MFQNKKVLILGLARSGYSVFLTLKKLGCEIIVNDISSEDKLNHEQIEKLKKLDIKCLFGSHSIAFKLTFFCFLFLFFYFFFIIITRKVEIMVLWTYLETSYRAERPDIY